MTREEFKAAHIEDTLIWTRLFSDYYIQARVKLVTKVGDMITVVILEILNVIGGEPYRLNSIVHVTVDELSFPEQDGEARLVVS